MATWKKVVTESSSGTISQATTGNATTATTAAAVPYTGLTGTVPTWNQNTSGNASTVTTNANLTGDITSSGNATTISADAIRSSHLDVASTHSNGKYLQATGGGSGITWSTITMPTVDSALSSSSANAVENHVVYDALATKVSTSGNETIAGNKTFSNNVIVTGGLTVNGTTTTVNSTVVEIGDNLITLNSDETGSPSQNGGLVIERGTAVNTLIYWDEDVDEWRVNCGSLANTMGNLVHTIATGTLLANNTAPTTETYNGVGSMVFLDNEDIHIRVA